MIVSPQFSAQDFDLFLLKWRTDKDGYARTSATTGVRKQETRFAHRVVLSRIIGRELTPKDISDHVNFDNLDCRRHNLRLTGRAGNSQHRNISDDIRGTTLHKCGKWQAAVDGKYVGLFANRIDAAKAAAKKRTELGYLTREGKAQL